MPRDARRRVGRRAVAWLAVLLAVAAAGPASAAGDTVVRREGDAIVYRGVLDAEANGRVRDLLAAGGIRLLDIGSGGGDIELGMDLGELVRRHALDVRVDGYCASSCANYVFPAGRRKLLPADAVVIWHGSAIQADAGSASMIDFDEVAQVRGRPLDEAEKAAMIAGFAAYGRAMRARQAAFYAELGVDERITVFGQDIGCGCDWTMPVADMARFGIDGIDADPGYGAGIAGLRKPVSMLRLDDHPAYAASIDAGRVQPGASAP